MSQLTMGEILTRRKLKKQEDPVKRYIPGQHKAVILSPTDAVVSFVDNDGAACVLPVEYIEAEDDWVHRGFLVRSTFLTVEARIKPRGGSLNGSQIDAIKAALDAKG